ncbi:leucine rich repeat-containing protein, partial [Cardiosporidium cionae]
EKCTFTDLESAFNIPELDYIREFPFMTRILSSFLTGQFIAVGWGKKLNTNDNAEIWDLFICKKAYSAEKLLECMYALSGTNYKNRVEVLKDVAVEECMKKHISSLENCLISNFAYREFNDTKTLNLYALTSNEIFEFSIDWKYWQCMPKSDKYFENYLSKQLMGLNNFLGFIKDDAYWDAQEINKEREKVKQYSTSWLSKGIIALSQSSMEKNESCLLSWDKLLTLESKHDITDIQKVSFEPIEECVMACTFRAKRAASKDGLNEMEMRLMFLDDTTREQWKRYVALALNQTEYADNWTRQWKKITV